MKKNKASKSLMTGKRLDSDFRLSITVKRILVFLVLLLMSLAAAFYIFLIKMEDEKRLKIEAYSEKLVNESVVVLADYLQKIQSEVRFVESSKLKRSINQHQKFDGIELDSELRQFVRSVSQRNLSVLSFRYFKNGEAKLDNNAYPSIRFADLDLIRRSEKGFPALPEVRKQENMILLTLVQSIKDGADHIDKNANDREESSEVLGTLVAVVDITDIKKRIQALVNGGVTKVFQRVDEKSVLGIFEVGGNATLNGGTNSGTENREAHVSAKIKKTASVEDSLWYVEFLPDASSEQYVSINITPAFVIPGIIIVLGMFIGFFVSRILIKVVVRQSHTSDTGMNVETNVSQEDDCVDPAHQTADISDIDINPEDASLLALEDIDTETQEDDDILDIQEVHNQALAESIPDNIFRAYDIRGLAMEEIGKEFTQRLGQALGSEALEHRETSLIVGRDARNHSPQLVEWLIRGILSSGCNVINIGTVPTPLMYFATETLEESSSGVIVTASHNPKEYNGFKIVMGGKIRSAEDIKALRQRILSEDVHEGAGAESHKDVVTSYVDTIFSDVALAGEVTVVVDAANAVPGIVAPRLLEELGCQVVPFHCDLDGNFPNHSPDPSHHENLEGLVNMVRDAQADLGIAFDGDGDRLAVVSSSGKIVSADQLLLLFAKDIISRNPGADVIYDVKSSRLLNSCVSSFGGRPIMWKTGHARMKEKMQETNALLGGEYSGHIFIKDRWFGFDDGMYAAARLLEILTLSGETLDELIAEFDMPLSTPEIRMVVGDERKFELVKRLIAEGDFADGKLTTLDGLRVDFEAGWGLVRASNTSSDITMRFEADDKEAMHKLQSLFARELKKIDPSLVIQWNS